MSASMSPITISYSGPPVKVQARRITRQMRVPNLGHDDPLRADENPASVVARLFEQAQESGALAVPAALHAECYADYDIDGGGFVLVVFARATPMIGVTCGWREVGNIAPRRGDPRPDNDRSLVMEALQFMASEMNAALGLRAGCSSES